MNAPPGSASAFAVVFFLSVVAACNELSTNPPGDRADASPLHPDASWAAPDASTPDAETSGPDAGPQCDASFAEDASVLAAPDGAFVVLVAAPKNGDVAIARDAVDFEAIVSGGTPPLTFVWESSRDGEIGSVGRFFTAALSVAHHEIRVAVTDAAGLRATSPISELDVLPRAWDWSHKLLPNAEPAPGNWTSPVRNQGTCNACYAFGSLGAIEGRYRAQLNDPDAEIDLSEQYVVDCRFSDGCTMGSAPEVLSLAATEGVPEESCDPYQARETGCQSVCLDGAAVERRWRIGGFQAVPPLPAELDAVSKWMMRSLVRSGALSGHLFIGDWDPLTHRCTHLEKSHYAVIVGYDHDAREWLLKNSWGPMWNGDGYFRVAYGECGIELSAEAIDSVSAP